MPSSAILDVAIGIAFVYLFLSLICSVVNETIAAIFSLRSKNLVAGIDSLLSGSRLQNGAPIVELLYSHGLVRGLYKDPPPEVIKKARAQSPLGKIQDQAEALIVKAEAVGNQLHVPVLGMVRKWVSVKLPAYIPSGVFATALIDIISPPDPARARDLNDVREAIDRLPEGPTRQALMSLVADTQKDLQDFQQKVEGWFNDSMERAAGWYKHRAQNILFCIALVVTLVLNVDTIQLAQALWSNPIQRQAAVDLAQKYVDAHKEGLQNQQQLQQEANSLAQLGQQLPFPFGWYQNRSGAQRPSWHDDWRRCSLSWMTTLVGWGLTTLALSLGAPFWFDTLNKFMVVRSTVKPKEKSGAGESKD